MVPSSPTILDDGPHSSDAAAGPSGAEASSSAGLSFRPQRDADDAVVRRAHAGHARWAAAAAGWPAEMVARLHDQQHDAQERHLAARHPAAERRMIVVDGVAVGRLCFDRSAVPWHLVDLALAPEAQGAGTGGAVLRRVLDEAARVGAAVILEVGRDNPRAEALYRRLGFVDVPGGGDTHHRLGWSPPR